MISDEFKCIFVHINKTAGSSIEVFFEEYPRAQHVVTTKCIEEYGRRKWNRYFKFSIVRNPWDRLLSWYLWVERDTFLYDWSSSTPFQGYSVPYEWGMHRGHPEVKSDWYKSLKPGFEKFVFSIKSTKDKTDFNLVESKHNAAKGKWIASQLTWLKNSRGEMPMDFIGRFENLQNDFKKICKKLNLEEDPLPKAKVLYNKPHYSFFYNENTIKRVEELYGDDIEYFDYKFEDKKDYVENSL